MNRLFSNTELKKLIFPLILEQALAITVGMADTMMVSSVGEVAVSGVSLVDMFNLLIFSVISALSTGGAVVVSQYLGASRIEEARKSAKQLLVTVFCFSLLLALVIITFRKTLLKLLFGRIERDVMEAALIYLTTSAFSFPVWGVYNSCAALFRAMGKTNITFEVSLIGNLINITGNAICIFGLHMGVAGVAIPSFVSRAVMGMILYNMLKNPKHEIGFVEEKFQINWKIVRNILWIGIPNGIENGIFHLGRVVVISIVSGFGTIQIAANGVANSLDNFGSLAGQAMNLAMITVIARCVGAADREQIRYYTQKLMLITYAATAVINIPVLLVLDSILAIYGLGTETTNLAKTLVLIHNGLAMVLWPMTFTFANMLRACNDVRYPMAISIFSMLAFRIGFSYLLGVRFEMGVIGVWIAMVIDWVFRIICFIGRYFHGDWKRLMYKLDK